MKKTSRKFRGAFFRFHLICLLGLVQALSTGFVDAFEAVARPKADPAQVEYFEKQVRPILSHRCGECHSLEKGAENGGLVLETIAGIAAGGGRGKLFPDASTPDTSSETPSATPGGLLLEVIEYGNPSLEMPPEGKLPEDEIAVLRKWVSEGAPLPEYQAEPRPTSHQIDFSAGKDFWSLRPLMDVQSPELSEADQDWCRRPLDAFVRAAQKTRDLEPSPEADPAVLLRRLTFDLIGLPPTPEEVTSFLADRSEDRYEKAVERLMESPHFGERWARVWLDLARYTDFTPDWQNPTGRGWLYRDWVVRAMNENMPYDRFVKLQIAGDLMNEVAPEDLAALGFLGLSPTYWKELRLAPSVIEQIVADEWDERIDAVSRTFLGLTVACARCHDHKFDPVSTQDYYALAGVFASTQLHERPLKPAAESARIEQVVAKYKDLQNQLTALKDKPEAERKAVEDQIAAHRAANPDLDDPWAHVLREASVYVLPDGDEMTRLDYRENEFRDLPVFRRGNPSNPGDVVARRYLAVFQSDPNQPETFQRGSGRLELADAIVEKSSGLLARVIVNRIWDQHFGAGLVRTTSDFGSQGDRPTHPELLEYLAAEFVRRGWDLKWLHQEIVTSSTYRQSSAYRDDAMQVDPANQLLWRANRRRLDIEMWRDAALAVTGQLDLRMGGPSRSIDDLDNVRRTLYVTVEREELNRVLRMHDFPEASSHSPRREPTTTPLQQLYVLNSPWMQKQSEMFWKRLSGISSDSDRIRLAWQLLYARLPSPDEENAALTFLSQRDPNENDVAAATESSWNHFLQALLGVNEFHFVD